MIATRSSQSAGTPATRIVGNSTIGKPERPICAVDCTQSVATRSTCTAVTLNKNAIIPDRTPWTSRSTRPTCREVTCKAAVHDRERSAIKNCSSAGAAAGTSASTRTHFIAAAPTVLPVASCSSANGIAGKQATMHCQLT